MKPAATSLLAALLILAAEPAAANHLGETEGTVHLENGAWLPDPDQPGVCVDAAGTVGMVDATGQCVTPPEYRTLVGAENTPEPVLSPTVANPAPGVTFTELVESLAADLAARGLLL